MTLEEAVAVADILDWADGCCSYCSNDLRERMDEAFPAFDWRKFNQAPVPRETIVCAAVDGMGPGGDTDRS